MGRHQYVCKLARVALDLLKCPQVLAKLDLGAIAYTLRYSQKEIDR